MLILNASGIIRAYQRSMVMISRIKLLKFKNWNYYKAPRVPSGLLCFMIFNVMSVTKMDKIRSSISEKDKTNENELSPNSAIIQADELFLIGKFKESYTVLSVFKNCDDVEILWRISRALYNMSKQKDIDKSDKESYILEAFHYVEKALSLSDNNFAVHKWMAILTDAKSSLEGIRSRISTLPIFKHHLLRAVELNPQDATSIYMLGQYMYNIADMSWVQTTIAKALFGTIPEASFEEAFHYFSKAEEVEPNFYSANLLMLGKTCLKLKRIEAAHYWLKCATSYPVRTDEDEAVKLEAEELLKKNPSVKNEIHMKEKRNVP